MRVIEQFLGHISVHMPVPRARLGVRPVRVVVDQVTPKRVADSRMNTLSLT